MTVTKKEYRAYQAEVNHWLNILGLRNYRICFEHKHLDGAYAQLTSDHEGYFAIFRLCTEANEGWDGPVECARHEVFHLLLAKLSFLARSRFIRHDELDEEDESIVRRLQNMFQELQV